MGYFSVCLMGGCRETAAKCSRPYPFAPAQGAFGEKERKKDLRRGPTGPWRGDFCYLAGIMGTTTAMAVSMAAVVRGAWGAKLPAASGAR